MTHKRFLFLTLMAAFSVLLAWGADTDYRFGPDAPSDLDRCAIFDANADGCTWRYADASLYYEGNDNPADDYIFLPPVYISRPGTYRITFSARRGAAPESLAVGFAPHAAPASMTEAATFSSEITLAPTHLGASFTFAAPGSYYPVLRVVSAAYGVGLHVSDIRLTDHDASYSLPLVLEPTASQAVDFTVIDADADGNSWHYLPDSLCFAAGGSLRAQADDWLLLPAVRMEPGHYAFAFEAAAAGKCHEMLEVRFGPDTVVPDKWQTLLTHPAAGSQHAGIQALMNVDSANVYRIALRLRTPGGDGLRLRRFSLQSTADTLATLPLRFDLDATFSGTDEEWLMLPPFTPPVYRNAVVQWLFRADGPRSTVMELYEGPVPEPALMQRVSSQYGLVNSEGRPMAASIYYDAPAGQRFLAFRIKGNPGCTGGIIKELSIDTVVVSPGAVTLPCTPAENSAILSTKVFGPFYVTDMNHCIGIDVAACSDYRLLWGRSPDLGKMVTLTDTLACAGVIRHVAAPLAYGAHWLALVPSITSTAAQAPMLIERLHLEHLPYEVTVPGTPSATAIRLNADSAEVTVVMPDRLLNGHRLWADEWLTLTVRSEVGADTRYLLPSDTIVFTIPVRADDDHLLLYCANYTGQSPETTCPILAAESNTGGAALLTSPSASLHAVLGGVEALNLCGETLHVYTSEGVCILSVRIPTDAYRLPLPHGLYLLRCADRSLLLRQP